MSPDDSKQSRDDGAARQLRDRLAESMPELQHHVLDSMSEGVSVSDEAGVIVYTNPAEDRMFGYEPGELIGQHVTVQNDYEPEENQRIVAAVIEELRRTGVWQGEWRNRRKDGSTFYTEACINAFELDGSRFWVCVQRDISQRKQIEQVAQDRDEMIRLAMRGGRMGAWARDIAGGKVDWNAELEEIFGLPPGGFPGSLQAFRELVHPDDRSQLARMIDEAVATHNDYAVEFRFHHASGEWRWMEGRGRAIYDRFGRPVRLYGIGVDVTERKRAEQTHAHLAAIVESSDDAIVSKSLDGIVTSWNTGAERLFGYLAQEMLGQSIDRIIPDDRQDEEALILERLRRGERLNHYETERRTKDGRLVAVSITISPMRDAFGKVIGASKVARDITERKWAEQALREADRRKDEFIATLAHELRNPLAPIRTAVRILKSPGAAEAQRKWSSDVIDRQVQHMARLLDDLLDVSRITRGKLELRKERMPISTALELALETARPLIESKGHALLVDLPPEPPQIEADPVRMTQVLGNLLTNAAKYTDPGGRVHVTGSTEEGFVVLRVRDNGIGMSDEMRSRLFEMFTQAPEVIDRADGGLGVGLAITKGLVELHGGSIEARSEGPGRGSEFIVRLPCAG